MGTIEDDASGGKATLRSRSSRSAQTTGATNLGRDAIALSRMAGTTLNLALIQLGTNPNVMLFSSAALTLLSLEDYGDGEA